MIRREIFKTVSSALDNNADVVIKLKEECAGKLHIPVNRSDKIAMEILEFLDREHGDMTVGELEQVIHSAAWWLTTTQIL